MLQDIHDHGTGNSIAILDRVSRGRMQLNSKFCIILRTLVRFVEITGCVIERHQIAISVLNEQQLVIFIVYIHVSKCSSCSDSGPKSVAHGRGCRC